MAEQQTLASLPDYALGSVRRFGVTLLNQQCWCWGQDIVRPEGNWLVELGFERIEPPDELPECASVYRLRLPRERSILLRGFGIFYGAGELGGVYLPRYEFTPRYTADAALPHLPWMPDDLPRLHPPREKERDRCATALLELLRWIHGYEVDLAERLGLDHRRETLAQCRATKYPLVAAEQFAPAWGQLTEVLAADMGSLIA